MKIKILMLAASLGFVSCQTTFPNVSLQTTSPIYRDVKTRIYKVGDLLMNSFPYVIKAEHPTAIVSGQWGPPSNSWIYSHNFSLKVVHRDCREIARTIAGLSGETGEYKTLGALDNISVYGRFARRKFPWGDAVTFLSQEAQDGPYSPDNGHMYYKVWGCTRDFKYLVEMSVKVTHPSWPEWGNDRLRGKLTEEELKADPDVVLLRGLPAISFTPSLTEIDALVSTLKIEH